MRKLAILLLIVIFTTTGCAVPNTNGVGTNKPSVTNNNTATSKGAANDNSKSDLDSEIIKHGVGETVDIKGVNVTLESVEMSYGDRDEEFSTFAPEDGKVFAVFNFLVENNSDEDFNISSLYFGAYEDGYSVNPYIFTTGIGVEALSGTASPGKKIKGALVYEVSEGFNELEIDYQPSVWESKKAIFVYKNQ
jgi:hypothetical protein